MKMPVMLPAAIQMHKFDFFKLFQLLEMFTDIDITDASFELIRGQNIYSKY